MRLWIACCAILVPLAAVMGAENPVAPTQPLPEGDQGLASKYPKDQGIDKDPKVIFADSFESAATADDLEKRWEAINGAKQVSIEEAQANVADGKHSLLITQTTRADSGGGLFKQLKPGFDRVHARFYVKFSKDLQSINHFAWLLAEKDAPRWPVVQAGKIPNGATRFSTGLEPMTWKNTWEDGKPYWHFYSYWHKMKPAAKGATWGKFFDPEPARPVERGRWLCVEFMLKANSAPDKDDGEHAFWLDGKLAGHWGGINWRSTNDLKISGFHLNVWREPTKQADVPVVHGKIWFDDVVLATEYIGPRGHDQ